MFKRFSIYTLTSIVTAVIGLLTTIYLTRNISPEAFGYIGIFGTITYLLTPMMSFNSIGLVGINLIDYSDTEYQKFFNSYLTFVIIISLILFILVVVACGIFPQYWSLIIMSYIISLLTVLFNIHKKELIQKKEIRLFSIVNILYSLLALVLTIVLVGFLDLDWEGRLLSIIISLSLIILSIYRLSFDSLRKYSILFDLQQYKGYLRYGYPLIIGLGAAWILTQSDKYIVLNYFNLDMLGYYSLAYVIGMKVNLFNISFVSAIVPKIYTALKEKHAKKIIKKYAILYNIFLVLFTAGAIIFFQNFGEILLGEKFKQSITIIIIILIAGGFDGAYRVHGLVIDYFKETKLKAKIAYFIAACNIVFSLLLIPYYGIIAPALGTLLSFFLNYVFIYYYSKKLFIKYSIT